MDIVAFITARLDEDEADARAAIADRSATVRWEAHGWYESNRMIWIVRDAQEKYASYGYPGHTPVAQVVPGGPRDGGGVATHIARHDPARVLRDVAAKRYRLELHWAARENRRHGAGTMGTTEEIAGANERLEVLELVMRSDAAAYADHPDYDESWRTE